MSFTTRPHPSDLEQDSTYGGDVVEMQPTRATRRRKVHMEEIPHFDSEEEQQNVDFDHSRLGREDGHGSGSGSGSRSPFDTHSIGNPDDLKHADLLIESETQKRAYSIGLPIKPQRTTSREKVNGTKVISSSTPQSSTQPAEPPKPTPTSRFHTLLHRFLSLRQISWIPPLITSLEAMKPVIRSAISAWIGLILLLIYQTESILGQAGFFAIVVASILPPAPPFIQTIEQMFYLFLFVAASWGWCVLAAFISIQVRSGQVDQEYIKVIEQKYPGLAATNPEQFAKALVSLGGGGGVFPRQR